MSNDRRDRIAAALCAVDGLDWAVILRDYPADVGEYHKYADAILALDRDAQVPAIADERVTLEEDQHHIDRVNAELRDLKRRSAMDAERITKLRSELADAVYDILTKNAENARLRSELGEMTKACRGAIDEAQHHHDQAMGMLTTIKRVRAVLDSGDEMTGLNDIREALGEAR